MPYDSLEYGGSLDDCSFIFDSGYNYVEVEDDIPGTFAWKEPDLMPTVAQSGKFDAIFTPEDTDTYEIVNFEVSVIVDPRYVEVMVNDTSKKYGEDDPGFYVHAENEVSGEEGTIKYSAAEREEGENVGDYAITVSGDEIQGNGNYIVHFNPGTFTIEPKRITVTADDMEMAFGGDLPELTYSYEEYNLVDGDEFTGTLAVDGELTIGEHDIVQGTLTIDDSNGGNNYEIFFETGTLTVKPVVTFDMNGYGTTPGIEPIMVTPGEKISQPASPEVEGYILYAWSRTKNDFTLADEWDFANDTVTENVTLYAQWYEKKPLPDVLALADGDVPTMPGAWKADENRSCYKLGDYLVFTHKDSTKPAALPMTDIEYKIGDNWVHLKDGTRITFNMSGGKLVSITVENVSTDDDTPYELDGTYICAAN